MSHIKSVGIELECGTDEDSYENLKDWVSDYGDLDNLDLHNDGSVHVSGCDMPSSEILYHHHDLEHFYKFINKAFKYIKQDSSCGNHIHVRFNKPQEAVAVWGYREAFNMFRREYIKAFGECPKYYGRLTNRYCRGTSYNENTMLDQLYSQDRTTSRYRMININAYNLHRTIEFRILPYFESGSEAIDSVKKLLSIIDKTYDKLLRSGRCHYSDFGDIRDRYVHLNNEYIQNSIRSCSNIDVRETILLNTNIDLDVLPITLRDIRIREQPRIRNREVAYRDI